PLSTIALEIGYWFRRKNAFLIMRDYADQNLHNVDLFDNLWQSSLKPIINGNITIFHESPVNPANLSYFNDPKKKK
ncbi:MAG: hypothetical protein AB8Z02_01275, partial [Coxiella endosymbiont of Haemaphysalis qinghaiensis]